MKTTKLSVLQRQTVQLLLHKTNYPKNYRDPKSKTKNKPIHNPWETSEDNM